MGRARTLLCAVAAAGCAGRVSGTLQIDGAPFKPTECWSGARYGVAGVQLADAAGKRVRASIDLIRPEQGIAQVIVFEPGQARTWEPALFCGRMTIRNQAGRAGNYRNVEGSADLSCATEAHTIAGHVDFAYCH